MSLCMVVSNTLLLCFNLAEDYNKFAFPASAVALVNHLSDVQTEEWLCLCRIVELRIVEINGWKVMLRPFT